MITSACVALINATFLLAVAAAGGVRAYTALYFFVALLLAGLRFTKQGANAAMMLMLTSLTTVSLASVAEAEGLDFVASLWTEKGVENPNAVFRNTLIGMCWAAVCISSGRYVVLLSCNLLSHCSHDVHLTSTSHPTDCCPPGGLPGALIRGSSCQRSSRISPHSSI